MVFLSDKLGGLHVSREMYWFLFVHALHITDMRFNTGCYPTVMIVEQYNLQNLMTVGRVSARKSAVQSSRHEGPDR